MSKYTPLETYLRRQTLPTTQVILTFTEIEEIIAPHSLPDSARRWFLFWDNRQGTSRADAWLKASFQTVMVDMENEKVKFRRVQGV